MICTMFLEVLAIGDEPATCAEIFLFPETKTRKKLKSFGPTVLIAPERATLDAYSRDFDTWRRMMAAMQTPEQRAIIFHEAAADVAQLVARGVDHVEISDKLHDMAQAYMPEADTNKVQAIIAEAIGRAREAAEVVPDINDTSYEELVDQAVLARRKHEQGELFDPWEQFIVPAFPLDVLPDVARKFVESQSVIIGCCPSALAMATLAAFSGALDHNFRIKMMRHGNWWEHPRLWVLVVSDPSGKKTPLINTVTRPLEDYQNYLREQYEAAMQKHITAGGEPDDANAPNLPQRFVVWDTTIEKLGELLSRSDSGLLVKRDEFSGWIGQMEKYQSARGVGADRGFWLQAFDGGPYAMDRIKRGEVYIRNLSVSLIGGIQPARLAELHGLTSDGLLQRFIPVMMGAPKLAQDQAGTDEEFTAHVRELIFAKPQRLILDDAAVRVMGEMRAHLFDLEQACGGLAEGFQTFVGKLAGYAGSLAIILHMADDPTQGGYHAIGRDTIANVRKIIVDFIVPHAFEFYSLGEGGGDRLKRLASYILTCGKDRILASDLTANVRDFRGLTLFQVGEQVSPLVAGGWLEPTERSPVCRAWNVTAAVGAQFVERVRTEEARKARSPACYAPDASLSSAQRKRERRIKCLRNTNQRWKILTFLTART